MKIAIIGAGIVGATCAYYLSKEEDVELKVFDCGIGQATKASAGIISPWFSKRRNKPWYKMARLGADFYLKLVADLENDGYVNNFYNQSGVYLLKKNDEKLEELLELAESRREISPMIGNLEIFSESFIKKVIPGFKNEGRVLYASGGGRVEGERFINTLIEASNVEIVRGKVSIDKDQNVYKILDEKFDKIIISAGAWLKDVLEPLNYTVDVRPQKGQLRDYQLDEKNTDKWPVIMPEGELDIIPFENGVVSIGATHENDMGFDLSIDCELLDKFEDEAKMFLVDLEGAKIKGERVGIRAYTSDYSPFYGYIPESNGLYVASGLGSSGLTTGPIIGYCLSKLVVGEETPLDERDYPVERYIERK